MQRSLSIFRGSRGLLGLTRTLVRFQSSAELMDPCCDPHNPKTLTFQQISIAQHQLKIRCQVYIKMEDTGSFKERGGRFALMNLTDEEKKNGVFAASAGNHAQALAIHGKRLGIKVTVVMPKHAPLMKINKCKELGANVIVEGKDLSVAKKLAMNLAQKEGGKYINGYDHIDVLAGAGTIAVEILEKVPDIDAILTPCGGGGLLAGCCVAAQALSPKAKIIGLVPENCVSMIKSLEAGKVTTVKTNPTLADGLAVPTVGYNSFHNIKDLVHKVIAVKETDIAVGILRLLETEKVVTEGAGAIGVSALLAGCLPELAGKKVACILSGGNIDSTMIGRCIEKGLAVDNRLIRVEALISDRPGAVAELAKIVADTGSKIKAMAMERAFHHSEAFNTQCRVIAETRGIHHALELNNTLKKRYGTDCNFFTIRGPLT
ncbi:unnamed protein product [Cylicocyclus nassatus]|uniref:L-serine deaminase n=1 Tax=Cylicocyclus nassatus TaxID=53992 RepID=A0AA36DRG6_CYLNA|nr:unnamed protein product [Cylicocyclus nassatus]